MSFHSVVVALPHWLFMCRKKDAELGVPVCMFVLSCKFNGILIAGDIGAGVNFIVAVVRAF